MFVGSYRQQEAHLVEIFWLVYVALMLACPVFLGLSGEKERAWQGLVVTIVLEVIAAFASAPMVIR